MGKKLLAHEYFKAPPYDVVLDPLSLKGRWHERFGRKAPLHVEIGMGLGTFLVASATRHPEVDHVGFERKMHRIYTARHRALRAGLRNIRFVPGDAGRSLDSFGPGEVSQLTLLFSDPWPKDPDKRLTAPGFIRHYERMLAPNGRLHFRTDDPDLFAYSLETLGAAGFRLVIAVELDRTITDFERRWLDMGRQIYALDAYKQA